MDDFEGTVPALKKCATKIIQDDETERLLLQVSEDTTDKDLYILLKDFRFPIAGQKMYKQDVWKWYADNNYTQVRSKTNFCQAPIVHKDGTIEPCGVCTACIGVIREKVLEPFTKEGLARYQDYEKNHKKNPAQYRLKGF